MSTTRDGDSVNIAAGLVTGQRSNRGGQMANRCQIGVGRWVQNRRLRHMKRGFPCSVIRPESLLMLKCELRKTTSWPIEA